MPEGFRGLTVLAPDFWAPLALLGELRPHAAIGREDAVGLHIVGRLKPGLSPGQALAQLVVWDSQRDAPRGFRRAAGYEPDARAEAGHGPAVGRRPAAVHAALLCVRPDPDDRVGERRQPAARARGRTPARNWYPPGDWRVAAPHRLAAAYSKACCSHWSSAALAFGISRLVLGPPSTR